MKPENGLAVRTITHMVHVPEGGAFDLDTVLQSNPSGETSTDEMAQRTIMSVHTEIGDLVTGTFDTAYLAPDPSYTEVTSPMN